jgi:hypothetical protein
VSSTPFWAEPGAPISWRPPEVLSEQELLIELRRVRAILKSGDRIEYSELQLKLRLKECVYALAQFTETGRGRALSEVPLRPTGGVR